MTALYTYAASGSADSFYMWLGAIVAIVAFGLSVVFLRKKARGRQHTNNVLMALLFFIAGLMGFTAAFFSAWSINKIGDVVLYAEHMNIGNKEIKYQDVRKLHFKEEKASSFLGNPGSGESSYYLVVETRDAQIFLIPNESFPIKEIRTKIKEITGQ